MPKCPSCALPIDDGTYCQHCTDDQGNLQVFQERFKCMTQWIQNKETDLTLAQAQQKTRAYMATMPAWQNHPELNNSTTP